MKKALALIMSVCMMFSTAVMASAAQYTINFVKDSGGKNVSTSVENVKYVVWDSGHNVIDSGEKSGTTFTLNADSGDWLKLSGNYTFAPNDFQLDSNYTIEVKVTNKSNGGGGNTGGGGNGGGGGTIIGGNKPTGTTGGTTTGTVSAATATAATTTAVNSAVKAAISAGAKSANAAVTLKNPGKMTPAVFKAINDAVSKAASSGVKVVATVQADTIVNGVLVARMYIDPVAAAALGTTIDTTINVSPSNKLNKAVADKFTKYFKNEVAIVSFNQKGETGMTFNAAVKLDLSKLNTQTLQFYSYDAATNKYLPMANTASFIDTNGYLHFTAHVGNSVVVTDSPLTLK